MRPLHPPPGELFYSGKEKLFDDNGHAPEAIQKQFASSFLHVFPGTDAAWVIVALIDFACLAFGETATGQNQGIASLYQYFAATAVILILVSLLPPNRPDRWLRSGGRG